jgi:lipopolysaccharide/colanic/teichoic acid biosynthesis glycosyltransferase
MESVTLPINIPSSPGSKTPEKCYKRFSVGLGAEAVAEKFEEVIEEEVEIPVRQEQKGEPEKKYEFFYIGRNVKKINLLVSIFDAGFTSESVHHAIDIFTRLVAKNTPPDIIIFEGTLGESALKSLHQFLSSNKQLSLVPIIMDASDISEQELKTYTRLQAVDEIVFLKESESRLLSKVDFLKKVKTQHSKLQYVKKIETSIGGITENRFFGKRLFDIIISLISIILLSPVFLLIAIVIKLESRGPVFYVSQRAGRGYRIFDFYKFRTMVMGADKNVDQLSHLNQYHANKEAGPVFFKVSNDPRITKVGAFLRNTSLDELPQLFNVLLGNMSLVGNRPLPLYEAATLTTDEWAARFLAPAGITGLWQIKKRGHKEMSVEERINLDITYAKKYNFLFDLWIMANTPFALVQKSNV